MVPSAFHLLLIVLTTIIYQVSADVIFQVRVHNYTNARGRDESNQCCGTESVWTGECDEECRTALYVCVRHLVPSFYYFLIVRRPLPCAEGGFVSDPIFGNKFKESNPDIWNFTIQDPWQGTFDLFIEARHKKHNDTDYEKKEKLWPIARFRQQGRSYQTEQWTEERQISSHGVEIGYSFRVICAPGYTGRRCTEKCPDPDDQDARFNCSDTGERVCREGWQGEYCDKPICLEGCPKNRGYCNQPGLCSCRMGWTGSYCNECVPLLGCIHGGCNKTFECICEEGWDGLFCNHPICKPGCHGRNGYCQDPGDCVCRAGWKGNLCDECKPLPGCQHGYCEKPLECKCYDGWSGVFCNVPICREDCHSEHGYCKRPEGCRCRIGWTGDKCDVCHPYPGCQNGTCQKPWECNCNEGWGGKLCDEKLDYCDSQSPCKNGGTCISQSQEDQYYSCNCKYGFTGVNCESELTKKDDPTTTSPFTLIDS